MIPLICLLMLSVSGPGLSPARAVVMPQPSPVGTWQYDGFFYQGHRYPNPNPNLVLKFTFLRKNISHLIWYRVNETGFCERKAVYKVTGDMLYQKVTWLNPANDRTCGQDPDMQIGKETDVRFVVENQELKFVLDLNGETFLYILRRCGPAGTDCPTNPQ